MPMGGNVCQWGQFAQMGGGAMGSNGANGGQWWPHVPNKRSRVPHV